MDECLDRQDIEGFHSLFAEYLERVGFGEEVPVADFDLIFANILVDGDHWTLIDYEWTFDRVIDTKALAFRAIYCYVLENERRNWTGSLFVWTSRKMRQDSTESRSGNSRNMSPDRNCPWVRSGIS